MKTFWLALRTIKSYPLYTVVNILGLALSLACTIVIARYINGELSVDDAHSKIDKICVSYLEDETGSEKGLVEVYQDMGGEMLSDAAIVKTCNINMEEITVAIGETPFDIELLRADSTFQDMLDFPIIAGASKIGISKNEVAITTAAAKKLFGNDNPIGKEFSINGYPIVVGSVLGELSSKGSLDFDVVINYDYKMGSNGPTTTMFLLSSADDYKTINSRYGKFVKFWDDSEVMERYQIIPLKELYFDASADWLQLYNHGDARSLAVMFIIGLAMLVIGVFNFVNIYTVLMLRRSREMGLKTVFGAPMTKLLKGIYAENVLMVALSIGIGWVLAVAFEPIIVGQLGIGAPINLPFDLLLSTCLVILVPILTSIYPYFKYRYQKTITTIQNVSATSGRGVSRAVFLVAQYIITVVIVVVSIFFVRQLNFMLKSDLGYQYSNVIKLKMFDYPNWLPEQQQMQYGELADSRVQIVEQRMAQSGLFIKWTYGGSPNKSRDFSFDIKVNGGAFAPILYGKSASSFFDMYAIPIVWGRGWNDSIDSWASYKCIVNEAFLRVFEIQDPATAVVQPKERMWKLNDDDPIRQAEMKTNPPYQIVGVCRDYQIGHLKSAVRPMMMACSNGSGGDGAQAVMGADFCAQIIAGRQAEAVAFIEKLYKEVGGLNFKYTMVEDEIAANYADDKKIALIYTIFAFIAIVISCLGLFSLSLYDVQRRTREIALRRVNGASVSEITAMLLRKYYGLLLLSFVIAMPAAWWAVEWYVADFAHRAPLSWWIFAAAGLITAAISLLTLIFQTRAAATKNPCETIKSN